MTPMNSHAPAAMGRVELSPVAKPSMAFFPDQNGGVYERLLATLPSFLHCMDGAGRMLSANAAWLDGLGYTSDEIVGRSFSEFLAPQSRSTLITEVYPKFLMTGKVHKAELTMRRKDGAVMPMQLSMTAYRGDKGRIDRSVCLLEPTLAVGEATPSTAGAESHGDIAFEYSAQGAAVISPDGKVEALNPAFLRLLEVPLSQKVSGQFDTLLHDKDRNIFHDAMRKLLEGEVTQLNRDLNFATPRGRRFAARCRLALVRNASGWPKNLVVEVMETDEKRGTDQQLQRAQRMEAVGQLAGGLAHDFNNLLTIIIGNLELLDGKPSIDDVSAKRVREAVSAARRGSEMNRQLLAVARKQDLLPQDTEINRLVSDMAAQISRQLGDRIALKIECMEGEPIAEIDAARLENAILNLAVNAREAMPPRGGLITVETVAVELDHHFAQRHADVVPGPYIMVAVSDNGSGMSAEVLDQVFQPFFTTKPDGQGAGLGLSIVYGFIKQSGGHINIYSEVGHGTSVKMYLPRKMRKMSPNEPAKGHAPHVVALAGAPTPVAARKPKILVVEDQEAVRAVAMSFLEDFGYDIVEAGDGLQALSKLQEDAEIDLMFTDVVMPGGLNGFDLAQAARTLRPELKIVHTTGYPKGAVVHQDEPRLKNGFIIMKPYRRDDLKAMIARALANGTE